jgi:dTDP-4-dehydrorhamnose 3,5-epimerase
MKIQGTFIKGLYCLEAEIKEDERGYFYRSFCKNELALKGVVMDEIVQSNHAYNKVKGTFRGLHVQAAPHAEEKIVKCIRGSVVDVVVDLRRGSDTFLRTFTTELSAENHRAVLIPKGCAHGAITLADHTELIYLHSHYYNGGSELGFSVFDPRLNITLPIAITAISERDQRHQYLDQDFSGLIV